MGQEKKDKKGFLSYFLKNNDKKRIDKPVSNKKNRLIVKNENEDFINFLEGNDQKKEPVSNKGLTEAPSGQRFFVFEGPSVKSLDDLSYYLGTMTERQIRHHVTEDKNDFASWVRDVLKQDKLANDLEKTKNREEMINILNNFLNSK